MAVDYMAWELAFLVERVRQIEGRVERGRLRDIQNPFHLPRDEFMDCFRLTPELVIDITNELRADIQSERITGLAPQVKTSLPLVPSIRGRRITITSQGGSQDSQSNGFDNKSAFPKFIPRYFPQHSEKEDILAPAVTMSNIGTLEQQTAGLQISHQEDGVVNGVKAGKKMGPAVPPKPKKSQPQVPQSYVIKTPPVPSYSTLLNNSGSNEKPMNMDTKLPPSHVTSNVVDNTFPHSSQVPPTNARQEQLAIMSSPQVPHEDRLKRAIRNTVYSNVEPPVPILVPATMTNGEELIYSNIKWNLKSENTYSNILAADHNEDLPPPPETTEYVPCVTGNVFPPPPEELPPPPSPVSSSYSELRRATYEPDYPSDSYPNDIYGPDSQSSSTYESIYEPINPRPPSQLSCNYSMYSGYGSATSTQPRSKISSAKEVDELTDLLVQGMEDAQGGTDIYGICAQCGEKVEGEGTGCSAMDKVFHINCFCCFVCRVNLQGKPFYSLEAKPFCEVDYLNTLEKCCVCTRPILDRILRATGKPYHPSCFSCVVCGQSLDGIPFTVDATNQIHCIQCFHKKFAPRCCVCKLPIMPEPGQDETVRVVALDRSFHIQCYKCEDCGLVLSSDSEGRGCYPLDDHVLCKSCNATRVRALTSHMTTEL